MGENRNLKLPLGWIAVHTGKGRADEKTRRLMHHLVPNLPSEAECQLGAVVGLCYVSRAVRFQELRREQGCLEPPCSLETGAHTGTCRLSPFAHGPWCNILAAAVRLPKPVQCAGGRNYWPLTESVRTAIVAQLSGEVVRVDNNNAPLSWPLPWL